MREDDGVFRGLGFHLRWRIGATIGIGLDGFRIDGYLALGVFGVWVLGFGGTRGTPVARVRKGRHASLSHVDILTDHSTPPQPPLTTPLHRIHHFPPPPHQPLPKPKPRDTAQRSKHEDPTRSRPASQRHGWSTQILGERTLGYTRWTIVFLSAQRIPRLSYLLSRAETER